MAGVQHELHHSVLQHQLIGRVKEVSAPRRCIRDSVKHYVLPLCKREHSQQSRSGICTRQPQRLPDLKHTVIKFYGYCQGGWSPKSCLRVDKGQCCREGYPSAGRRVHDGSTLAGMAVEQAVQFMIIIATPGNVADSYPTAFPASWPLQILLFECPVTLFDWRKPPATGSAIKSIIHLDVQPLGC